MKSQMIKVLFLVLIVSFSSPSFGAEPIKLGVVDFFSGMSAYVTGDRWKGEKFAALEANETGGVLGRKIELIPRDDMGSPDTAVKHMEELFHRHKVSAILGNGVSSTLLAMSRWGRDNKCLVFAMDGRTDRAIVNQGHRYLFRSLTDCYMDAAGSVQFVSKKPWKKFACIAADYEYGHMSIDNFEAILKKVVPEAEITTKQWPKIGEIDYTPYITAILASKADHIYSVLWGGDAMGFIKQALPIGLLDKVTMTIVHLNNTILEPFGKAMPEGVYANVNYTHTIPSPENKDFVSRWVKEYGTLPGDVGFAGYVGVKFVIEGIKKAKSADTEKLIDALEGLTIKTPVTPITLRKFDHQGDMACVIGKTMKAPETPNFLVVSTDEIIPGDKIMRPISLVQELRAKEK